jgi:hypothetical protein
MANNKNDDFNDQLQYNKIRKNLDDSKWQNYGLKNPKPSKEINLGKHENHDWQPIKGNFGPHTGKIICNSCGGKWVAWLPKNI